MKILSTFAHASYQRVLALIPGATFYHVENGLELKSAWPEENKPDNVFEIQESEVNPKDFDVLIMHRHEQLQKFEKWNIKKIFVEHTGPYPYGEQAEFWKPRRKKWCNFTVFITHTSRTAWHFDTEKDCTVIRHGIDVNSYPKYSNTSENYVQTTVNEFLSRDWATGYQLWQQVIWPFNDVRVYGYGNDNLGKKYSKGSVSHNEILNLLTKAGVYLNPSLVSPVPMSLLEALAVGTPCVSTAYYEPGIVMKNLEHGRVTNDPVELRKGIKFMLENREEAIKMGEKGKEMVRELFSIEDFILNWRTVLENI